MIDAQFPECFEFLFEPSRFKVIFGGRGSGKSVNVAKALLIQAAEQPLRILCARELQASIKDSVHKLLSDEIDAMGLQDFYTVQNASIRGINGSEFIFKGLRHNVSEVKSMHGLDRVWCEEAQMVSKLSWETLIPTVRKDGSEIWMTFNPILETDATYQKFVVNPPPDAIVRKVNWDQNPFFPDVLYREMMHMKEVDPDAWACTWEGHCRQTLDGAIYARELRDAQTEGRICKVPYDPIKPVDVAFDLGWADHTAIWFAQTVGLEYRIIDFMEDNQRAFNHYLQELQQKPYIYGRMFLPHDAQAKQIGSGKSVEEIARAAGWRVSIVPRLSVEDGINAVRTVFPNLWIDQEKCADGLQHLRHYRYDVDPETNQFSRKPLHCDASHSADAMRYLCVSLKPKAATGGDRYTRKYVPRRGGGGHLAA